MNYFSIDDDESTSQKNDYASKYCDKNHNCDHCKNKQIKFDDKSLPKDETNRRAGSSLDNFVPNKSSSLQSDPFLHFALHVAEKLRQYEKSTAAQVQHAISDILYDADMGKFENARVPPPKLVRPLGSKAVRRTLSSDSSVASLEYGSAKNSDTQTQDSSLSDSYSINSRTKW